MTAIGGGRLPGGAPPRDELSCARAGLRGRAHCGNNSRHGDAAVPYLVEASDGDSPDCGHREERLAREAPQPVEAERPTGIRFRPGLKNRADSQIIDVANAGPAYLAGGTARKTDQAFLHFLADRRYCCESVVVRS